MIGVKIVFMVSEICSILWTQKSDETLDEQSNKMFDLRVFRALMAYKYNFRFFE